MDDVLAGIALIYFPYNALMTSRSSVAFAHFVHAL